MRVGRPLFFPFLERVKFWHLRARSVKEPRNYAKVGYSMIVVAASLAAIGLIALAIADDVLFSDKISRANTAHFDECKAGGFADEGCKKYCDRINNRISGIYVEDC